MPFRLMPGRRTADKLGHALLWVITGVVATLLITSSKYKHKLREELHTTNEERRARQERRTQEVREDIRTGLRMLQELEQGNVSINSTITSSSPDTVVAAAKVASKDI